MSFQKHFVPLPFRPIFQSLQSNFFGAVESTFFISQANLQKSITPKSICQQSLTSYDCHLAILLTGIMSSPSCRASFTLSGRSPLRLCQTDDHTRFFKLLNAHSDQPVAVQPQRSWKYPQSHLPVPLGRQASSSKHSELSYVNKNQATILIHPSSRKLLIRKSIAVVLSLASIQQDRTLRTYSCP